MVLQKHHYRELDPEVRESLGKLPEGFVTYWLRRFPLLLPHVWLQMQQFRHEDILQTYYPHTFTFSRDDVFEFVDEIDCMEELPLEFCGPERNELFLKSRVYFEVKKEPERYLRYRKEGSPRKIVDWRSEQGTELRLRQDDIRMRDRHYKKKEKKKEEVPVWCLPPQ